MEEKNVVSRRGFSIMEVMVALVIAVIVITLIAKALSDAGQESRRLTQKNDYNSLVAEIQTALNSTSTCLNAFPTGQTLPALASFAEFDIALKVANNTIAAGTKYGGITIKTLRVISMDPSSTAPSTYILRLKLVAARKSSIAPAVSSSSSSSSSTATEAVTANDVFAPNIFSIIVGTDPLAGNKIVRCAAQIPTFWIEASNNSSSSSVVGAPVNIAYTGGAVGIKELYPQNDLDVNGTFYAVSILYQDATTTSDVRLKKNIRNIPDPLDKILQLHGVEFDWKNPKPAGKSVDNLGFIAQDVEKIFPEAVRTHPKTGIKSVSYEGLIAPLVEAVKEQQKIIQQQQKEIAEIKKALNKK